MPWWEKELEMSKRWFFLNPNQIVDGKACLDGTDAHHIINVLRLKTGDRIILANGLARTFAATIEYMEKDRVLCAIGEEIRTTTSDSPRVTLVQGLPKGDKMDLIIEKGAELGLHEFIPLLSERVVVKLTEEKLLKRRERWQRIAMEAAKQCRRPDVPSVSKPMTWTEVLESLPLEGVALIPWEEETNNSLKSYMRSNPKPAAVYYFIGPEGGFSLSEVETAREYGVCPVTIGSRILRTETAGLAVATMLFYQWGDLGGE